MCLERRVPTYASILMLAGILTNFKSLPPCSPPIRAGYALLSLEFKVHITEYFVCVALDDFSFHVPLCNIHLISFSFLNEKPALPLFECDQ